MSPADEREMLELLTRLVRSAERIEGTLCGAKPPRPPQTAEEREAWREVNRAFGRMRPEVADDEGGLPPSGGVPPETFWRRKS